MTDPFWMIMVAEHLGGDYYVWDKAAEIEFVKPGRGKVETTFQLGDDVLDAIRTAAQGGDKHLHWFESVLHDEAGDVVARVRKQVYVRLKQRARAPAP